LSALVLLLALHSATAARLVVGTLAEPVSLDPHRSNDIVASEIVANVCETLVRIRPGNLTPEGVLATTWATADRRVWTFTLRDGVRFQDGTPFDADAVVANLEHLRLARTFPGRAERLGPHLLQLTLERADAALLPTLSQPHFVIQSPRQLASPGSPPVGTGPFRIQAVRRGSVELVANAEYWGGPPRLARLVFHRFADPAALVEALLSGAADVSSALGPAEVSALRQRPQIAIDSQTGINLVYLAVNDERAPLRDVRLRQALSRAIDRPALLRLIGGHGAVANGPLPPSVSGRGARGRALRLDRESARGLIAAVRLPEGAELGLSVARTPRPYLSEPLAMARRIRDDLAEVGLTVRLHELPTFAEQVERTTRGDYELALLGWRADTLDPNDFLTALLDSSSIGTTNRSRYRSEAMDSLLKRARMDGAPRVRQAIYRAAFDLFQRDMPFVPLLHASSFTAQRRNVVGVAVGPTGI
jgi:peptide/nickel transport system substrate-binding protein